MTQPSVDTDDYYGDKPEGQDQAQTPMDPAAAPAQTAQNPVPTTAPHATDDIQLGSELAHSISLHNSGYSGSSSNGGTGSSNGSSAHVANGDMAQRTLNMNMGHLGLSMNLGGMGVMDGKLVDKSRFLERFPDRPIILSPPPMDNGGHTALRNQSVGYNLRQEFETLKADLDLDLSLGNDGTPPQDARYDARPHLAFLGGSLYLNGPLMPERPLLPSQSGYMFGKPQLQMPARPQLVNDFSPAPRGSTFYQDMLSYTAWLEGLTPQELVAMLDYWCLNLPFDILLTIKSKLQNHPQGFGGYAYQGDGAGLGAEYADMDQLHLGEPLAPPLAQPKPKTNAAFKSHLFANPKVQRPKLADPLLRKRFADTARSPTLHLYEMTSFLQQAAASQSPHASNPVDDMELATAKLGALATINSRVALDSGRKPYLGRPPYDDVINRTQLLSVPAQKYSVAAMAGKKKDELPVKPRQVPTPPGTLMPTEIASQDLLNNIPAWLKLLRLHKYTDCLKDIHWAELVELDDDALEEKGVKALGARRKLLKAFEAVRLAKA